MTYHPVITLFNTDISVWLFFGWLNILSVKFLFIFYCWKKGWEWKKSVFLTLAFVFGSAAGAMVLPSVMGAVLGGTVAFAAAKRALHFPYPVYGLLGGCIALIIAVGRFGCLLSGCCFGSPTGAPLGVVYQAGSPAHWLHFLTHQIGPDSLHSLPVHPIQLYESLFLFIWVFFIFKLRHRFKNSAVLLIGFTGSYLLFRGGIEFIRDMSNVWWSARHLGPLSWFQWFLFGLGAALLAGALAIARKPVRAIHPPPLSFPLELQAALTLLFLTASLSLYKGIHPVHLMQIIVFLPICALITLHSLILQYRWRPAVSFAGASFALVLALFPMAREVYADIYHFTNDGTSKHMLSLKTGEKTWFYELHKKEKKIIRVGDENTTPAAFSLTRARLHFNQSGPSQDSTLYQKVYSARRKSGVNYYGAAAMSGYKYERVETSSCGSENTTYYEYQHETIGGTLGIEKELRSESSDITGYLGLRGTYFKDTWTEFVYGENSAGGPRSQPSSIRFETDKYFDLSCYGNVDFKLLGLGVGITSILTNSGYPDKDFPYISNYFPILYARLGPPILFGEAGVSDRYVLMSQPVYARMGIGSRFSRFVLRGGILTIGGADMSYFNLEINTQSGFAIQPGFAADPAAMSNWGYQLKVGKHFQPGI